MMDSTTALLSVDLLMTGFAAGTTVFFFFIQSPLLIKRLGREKFVPIMMALTKLFFQVMFPTVTTIALTSVLINQKLQSPVPGSSLMLALTAWLAVAINHFLCVPMALQAGARSHQERKGDNGKDLTDFAVSGGSKSSGGGKSQTKTLHQTVVVFVLIMTAALVAHLVVTVSSLTM
jgi:uncharacterized membrane protein YgcG